MAAGAEVCAGNSGVYKTEAKSKERAGAGGTGDERNGYLVSRCPWPLPVEHALSELGMRKLREFSFAVV